MTILLAIYFSSQNINATVVTATVTISDTDPTITNINCYFYNGATYEDGPYTPSAKTDYPVYCSVDITDNNSYQDIKTVWAKMYHTGSSSYDAADDDDVHYSNTNTNCTPVKTGSCSGSTCTFNCTFSFKYYADAGTWRVNIRANDTNGGTTGEGTHDETINSIKAIESQALLNLGTLGPGQTSPTLSQTHQNNNTGNDDTTITVQASADLSCTQGTIPLTNTKYAKTEVAYASACGNLTTNDEWQCPTLTIPDREDSGTGYQNTTYWGIAIPLGVSGSCNTTITFTAN